MDLASWRRPTKFVDSSFNREKRNFTGAPAKTCTTLPVVAAGCSGDAGGVAEAASAAPGCVGVAEENDVLHSGNL